MTNRRQFLELKHKESEMSNAQDVIDLIDEFEGEILGFQAYLSVLKALLNKRYKRHRRASNVVEATSFQLQINLVNLRKLKARYRSVVADLEHIYGKTDHKPVRAIAPIALNFEELMAVSSFDKVMEDFLDE